MLAAITGDSLVCLEQAALKKTPSSAPSASSLATRPTCCTWATDNSALFVATRKSLDQYDSTGSFVKALYRNDVDVVTSIVSKDKCSTLFFSSGSMAYCLEVQSGKISQTFNSHKGSVSHLALSTDGNLLASTSENAVHVHSLTLSSHIVLRGLPSGGAISACEFHPHSKTRLLLGSGTQLLVYDTTRPSGAVKTVTIGKDKSCAGHIVAIASSPFSKSLVAVACGGGTVGLVDLDKEKGLFRVLQLNVLLTALAFSPEGASLYAGTEDGNVLVQELRSLDKAPRAISVSDNGQNVIAMCVQRKLKAEETPAPQRTISKPLAQQDTNKNPSRRVSETISASTVEKKTASKQPQKPSPVTTRGAPAVKTPAKPRAVSSGTPRPVPRARTSSATVAPSPLRKVSAVKSPGRKVSAGIAKRVFSPPTSGPVARTSANKAGDGDVSVCIDELLAMPKAAEAKENAAPTEIVPAVPSASSAPSQSKEPDTARARTRTASSSGSAATSATASSASGASSRTRITSNASASARSASAAGRQKKSSTSSTTSVPPVPAIPSAYRTSTQPSGENVPSRTPSPDLPDIDAGTPITPVPAAKVKGKERAAGMGVLGLGTPAVERWIKAGEIQDVDDDHDVDARDGKRVGFLSSDDEDEPDEDAHSTNAQKPELAMQVSPRRLPSLGAASNNWAPVLSPMRNAHAQRPGIPASPQAKDMLQALLRDALYDFRQETRSEILGLHLDLVRMGRGWRREMREAMDEFSGEIHALREENTKLREENERLKRGY